VSFSFKVFGEESLESLLSNFSRVLRIIIIITVLFGTLGGIFIISFMIAISLAIHNPE
jgi:hypothetical protein